MTNRAKSRNGHLWTFYNKVRVFLVFKGLNEKFFGTQFVRKCFPKYLETNNICSLQIFTLNSSKNCCFCTMNFEVTCFKIGFTIFIFENLQYLFQFEIFLQSKYIKGFKFWEIFVYNCSEFFLTWSKKREITKISKYKTMRMRIESKSRDPTG